jgi:hypothetical protein
MHRWYMCVLSTTISCVPAEDLPAAVQRVEIALQNASAVCVHAPTTISCVPTEVFQAAAQRVVIPHQNALRVHAHALLLTHNAREEQEAAC